MQVAIQPCSDSDAQEHYIDTIANKVAVSRMVSYLEPDQAERLVAYGNDAYAVWGVTRGKSDGNYKKWGRLSEGSLVLLYRKRKFFASGFVTQKFVSAPLANELWKTNKAGETWECMFVLTDVRELELDITSFNRTVGYSDSFIVQGFNVLDELKSEKVAELLELNDSNFYPPDTDNADELNKQLVTLGSTDMASVAITRRESGIFRKKLFPRRSPCKCALCAHKFPAELMVAAHIKMRASCSEAERLDMNVVMPVCKFGCDDLYERGFVTVDDTGKVQPSPKAYGMTRELDKVLGRIAGQSVIGFSTENEKYYRWHRQYRIFKG